MKRILIFILLLILFATAVCYGADYSDVKSSNWAHSAVSAMSEREIVEGYPDGSFKPSNTVKYGEFIKMALIANTGSDPGNATEGHWASNYYEEALNLGYFTTSDIAKSNLSNNITRAHMALIISSILGDVEIDNYDDIQKGITDITYQTKYEADITKAYASGILTGYTDKTFKPDRTLTRAEAATVIYRLVDESKRILPGTVEMAKETLTETVPWYNPDKKDYSNTKTYTYYVENAKLGDYGITKIEIQSINGTLNSEVAWIYSTICYDRVTIFFDNVQAHNTLFVTSEDPAGKEYIIKDGLYAYRCATKGEYKNIKTTGTSVSLRFWDFDDQSEDIETIYRFTDVTL